MISALLLTAVVMQAPAAQTPADTVDKLFVQAAVESHHAEIAFAQIASQHAGASEVKGFAAKMIEEHNKVAEDMRAAVERVLTPGEKPQLSAAHKLALDHLKSVSPVDFDQQYLLGQISDHIATLALFQTEAEKGSDAELKRLAAKWAPTVKAHLELAIDLTQHVGGSSPFKTH